MTGRVANPWWFRADGALLPWSQIFNRHLEHSAAFNAAELDGFKAARGAVAERPLDLHLRWSCAKELGVPYAPFTVWRRPKKDVLNGIDVRLREVPLGQSFGLRRAAAIIEVDCTVNDAARAVALFASRTSGHLRETVGAASTMGLAGSTVTLRVRCGGATRALLVNAILLAVRVQFLEEVINLEDWQEVERVGLPIKDSWEDTAYDTAKQGLMAALSTPRQAALERLKRGGPPLGWFPLTEAGRPAPDWRAPDSELLVEELSEVLLPRIAQLYRPGQTSLEQRKLLFSPAVDGPKSVGRPSSLSASATLPPLALLALPASADPFLALASGFGTAYNFKKMPDEKSQSDDHDYLITAPYTKVPNGQRDRTLAAFIPAPTIHGATVAPTDLRTQRLGLIAPGSRDEPWRESVRISWNRELGRAALGRPTGASLARYETTNAAPAESMLPRYKPGDLRPLLIVPDGPADSSDFSRAALIDAAAEIVLGSGGRHPGYAVAVQDVYGVWSRWRDAAHDGPEPAPPAPRVITLSLESQFVGSSTCPAELVFEVSLDWANRTPDWLELSARFYPMPAANTPPPTGMGPLGPAPAGGFGRNMVLQFVSEALTGPANLRIEHLDADGAELVSPGPLQGNQGRRYRLRLPVPSLDFAATPRWGVQLWVRSRLAVLGVDSAWTPEADHPALASAASPVPALPLPPPQPPGVPLASTQDAQGSSHGRIGWSFASGADVRTVIVWEVSETALRQRAGLPQRADEGRLPGWRLADLRAAYDALAEPQRRAAFRRVLELPGHLRETDVVLPRGSQDIHLYTVTAVTSTGVESPWPTGPEPHLHLQALTAPRLRQPAVPDARANLGTGGTVTLTLNTSSRIPVERFELFRHRSSEVARNVQTMGPAFAVVPATAPPAGSTPDPFTAALPYSATWSGTFPVSWDEWLLRVAAVPVQEMPTEAVRGQPSEASDVLSVLLPPETPPDLEPLSAEVWGAGHDGVLVHSSSSAPFRLLGLGVHQLSALVGTAQVNRIVLPEIVTGPIALTEAPPPDATTTPVLVRGARVAGRTPLALWFTRSVAADPVEVVVRLADPLGRISERRLTVPGWTPPPPAPPTLVITKVFTISGRGVVIEFHSDASFDVMPPHVLHVEVTPGLPKWWQLKLPIPGQPLDPIPRVPKSFSGDWPLNSISTAPGGFTGLEPLQVVRNEAQAAGQYLLFVRLQPPFHLLIRLELSTGGEVQVTQNVLSARP